jgi:hypothetical protein
VSGNGCYRQQSWKLVDLQESAGVKLRIAMLFLLIRVATCYCQSAPVLRDASITLTGIVLASDHRCARTQVKIIPCRSSDWALDSGGATYLLYGDIGTLERFERKRVKITGSFQQEFLVEYGVHVIRRKVFISSINASDLAKDNVETLVSRLKVVPWRGPENHWSPMSWDFAFTDPMTAVLDAGPAAQEALLRQINDETVQDQVVMLLGGVGDERAIGPIIKTMTDGSPATLSEKAKRLNVIGNLALTNLTVSEVIWHHGGGIPVDRCPDTPKSCWSNWWSDHHDNFKVGVGGDRLYSNYPNYGIYAQFGDTSIK